MVSGRSVLKEQLAFGIVGAHGASHGACLSLLIKIRIFCYFQDACMLQLGKLPSFRAAWPLPRTFDPTALLQFIHTFDT